MQITSQASYSPTEITGTDSVASTFRLRYQVWAGETQLKANINSQGLISDEHDAHAQHWAVFVEGRLVAAARMCVHEQLCDTPDALAFSQVILPSPIATINRLVVHPSARGLGLASKLDEYRINAARKAGARCVVGTAAKARIPQLHRLGFELTGSQWVQPYATSLLFYAMVLVLDSRPS